MNDLSIGILVSLISFALILVTVILIKLFSKKKYLNNNSEKVRNQQKYTNFNSKTDTKPAYTSEQQIPSAPKQDYVYRRKAFLLSKNEHSFYKQLIDTTNKMNLLVFAKVRMEDIIEVDKNVRQSWEGARSRIKSRHVDFVLCDSMYLRPLAVIELDDASHHRQDRQNRDIFVDMAMKSAGLPILHVNNSNMLEERLASLIPQYTLKKASS